MLLLCELKAYLFEPLMIFLQPLQVSTSLAFISLKASPTFRLTSGDASIISKMFLLGFLVWLLVGHALKLFGDTLLEELQFYSSIFRKAINRVS